MSILRGIIGGALSGVGSGIIADQRQRERLEGERLRHEYALARQKAQQEFMTQRADTDWERQKTLRDIDASIRAEERGAAEQAAERAALTKRDIDIDLAKAKEDLPSTKSANQYRDAMTDYYKKLMEKMDWEMSEEKKALIAQALGQPDGLVEDAGPTIKTVSDEKTIRELIKKNENVWVKAEDPDTGEMVIQYTDLDETMPKIDNDRLEHAVEFYKKYKRFQWSRDLSPSEYIENLQDLWNDSGMTPDQATEHMKNLGYRLNADELLKSKLVKNFMDNFRFDRLEEKQKGYPPPFGHGSAPTFSPPASARTGNRIVEPPEQVQAGGGSIIGNQPNPQVEQIRIDDGSGNVVDEMGRSILKPAPEPAPAGSGVPTGGPGAGVLKGFDAYEQGAMSIAKSEGFRAEKYWDGSRFSQGYGSDASKFNKESITQEEAYRQLVLDMREHGAELEAKIPAVKDLPPSVHAALLDIVYNTGLPNFTGGGRLHEEKFDMMMGLLIGGEYDKAADLLLTTKWAERVKSRAPRVAELMRSG